MKSLSVQHAQIWCEQCQAWRSGKDVHWCFILSPMGCWCCEGFFVWRLPHAATGVWT